MTHRAGVAEIDIDLQFVGVEGARCPLVSRPPLPVRTRARAARHRPKPRSHLRPAYRRGHDRLRFGLGDNPVVRGFSSGWGHEFEPFEDPVDEDRHRDRVRSVLARQAPFRRHWRRRRGTMAFVVAPMWSGNWACRGRANRWWCRPHNWGLGRHGVLARPATGASFDALRRREHRAVAPGSSTAARPRRSGPPPLVPPLGRRAAPLPMEWNHWFPYTDTEISESIFFDNVDAAGEPRSRIVHPRRRLVRALGGRQ